MYKNYSRMKNCVMRILVFFALILPSVSLVGQAQIDSLQELLNKKEYAKIIALTGVLTAEDSTSYDVMYALGQAYDGMLRYKAARSYYDICYRMDTTNVEILNILAQTANNQGKTEDAERFFLKVLEADTLSFYANNQLANFYYRSGKYGRALLLYKRLSDIDQANPALLIALGNCYLKMEIPPLAILNYYNAFSYAPENVQLASTLINTMLAAGEGFSDKALEICDTALFYNPGNRQLMQNKGMAFYANEFYSEADTLYTNLMEAGDSTYVTVKYCGLARYNAGLLVAAVEPLEQAYLMDTTSIDVCLYLGSALGQTYDRKRAFLLFEKAEEMLKPSFTHKLQLGTFRADTYWRDGRKKEASQLYYGLWKEYPGRMDLLYQIYMMNTRFPFDYNQTEEQQAALFAQITFTKALLDLDRKNQDRFLYSMRVSFRKIYDEMIFNEKNSLPLLAPDGEKSSITLEELYALIERLPNEPPAGR